VNGERADLGWTDDALDRQGRAELLLWASSRSPRVASDRGVSTNPAAIRFTRMGASSYAMLFVRAESAAVTVEMNR
jgi:hypothetical protein